MSDLKKLPDFESPEDEAEFWETHDSTEYLDWSKAQPIEFPNLKLSTTAISLRLPQWLLARLKEIANRTDVPYQSLIKMYLSERVELELVKTHSARMELASSAATAPETLHTESKGWVTKQVETQQGSRLATYKNVSSNKDVAAIWQNTFGQ